MEQMEDRNIQEATAAAVGGVADYISIQKSIKAKEISKAL